MAGPSVSILLETFDDKKLIQLDTFIRDISKIHELATKVSQWEFTLMKNKFYPRKPDEQDCLFLLDIDEFGALYEEAEKTQIEAKIGWLPSFEISIAAMCNRKDDHKILGLLALQLAKQFEGYINMCGLIYPPVKNSDEIDDLTIEEIRDYVRQFPGRSFEIEYNTASDETWYYHIIDVEFMAHWLQQPRFFMIK